MDPQQRILLETTYTACENGTPMSLIHLQTCLTICIAGISLDALRGSKTGVFAGAMTDDFRLITVRDVQDIQEYATQGSSSSLLANRISWFFDLKGPSITLDTACSSSLTSLHLACQSLLLGESNLVSCYDTSTTGNITNGDRRFQLESISCWALKTMCCSVD